MSVVWEVPVVARDTTVSRRLLRATSVFELVPPRDARPRRTRRERMPERLRVWGAASRRRG